MVQTLSLAAVMAGTLLALPAGVSAMYSKNSPVLQVTAKNYDQLIARSNYTSILEFYAPWCGHCKNLQPAYEKAAKSLAGLAKVAAIDCDEESNKQFCGSMGVQGFPTLKILTPSKKPGKPTIQDYQGARTAKGISDAVVEKMPNHVARVAEKDWEAWLQKGNESAKAVLVSEKGTTSALIKSLAIDYLGGITFAQVRSKEKAVVDALGVTEFPTLVLLPGGTAEARIYNGEMKKDAMSQFLAQAAAPNPDPAPKKSKSTNSKKDKKAEKKKQQPGEGDKAKAAEADGTQASPEPAEAEAEATPVADAEESDSATTPSSAAEAMDDFVPVPVIEDESDLNEDCLSPKSTTCILLILPDPVEGALPEIANTAYKSLSEISLYHHRRKSVLFPLFVLPTANAGAGALRSKLKLQGGDKVELVAVNAKRGWWRRFEGDDFLVKPVSRWIETIQLGEGSKEKLPDGVVQAKAKEGHVEL